MPNKFHGIIKRNIFDNCLLTKYSELIEAKRTCFINKLSLIESKLQYAINLSAIFLNYVVFKLKFLKFNY